MKKIPIFHTAFPDLIINMICFQSLGKSLSGEAVPSSEGLKNYHCDDPVCDTNLWQVRHELDLARMKMRSLEVELRSQGIEPLPGFTQMDDDVEEINEFPCNT